MVTQCSAGPWGAFNQKSIMCDLWERWLTWVNIGNPRQAKKHVSTWNNHHVACILFLQKCKVITLRQPKLSKLTERKVGSKDELQQAMWPNRGRWCGRETWRPDTHIEKLIGFTASTTTEAPLSQRTSSNPYVARRPSASHSFPYQ
jgi:hypothetical protein